MQPGQFLLAAPLLRPGGSLARLILPASLDTAAGELSWLQPPPGNGESPAAWFLGEELALLGPAGRPFALDPKTRRAVLLADAAGAGTLLTLAAHLLERGVEVAFLAADAAAVPMPAALLPPEVEYQVQPAADDGWAAAGPIQELLQWGDQLFVALPSDRLPGLLDAVRRRLLRLRKGFAQALLVPPALPCGVGACDLCTVPTREGWRRACRDGLVFDLLSLA